MALVRSSLDRLHIHHSKEAFVLGSTDGWVSDHYFSRTILGQSHGFYSGITLAEKDKRAQTCQVTRWCRSMEVKDVSSDIRDYLTFCVSARCLCNANVVAIAHTPARKVSP